MKHNTLNIRRFEQVVADSSYKVDSVCVECGADLVVVIGGGERYHIGAIGLTIASPNLKDTNRLTHRTYQIPVPGHKEEALAREGSLLLSQRISRNVVLSVGIHQEHLSQDGIQRYVEAFYALIERIGQAYEA